MLIYQFVKYNVFTNLDHLNKYSKTGAVVCFDLEDSVFDWVNPNNSKQLKADARIVIDKLYNRTEQNSINSKFGIRINAEDNCELEKDIALLSGKKIHSLFIPKVSTPEQITTIYNKLKGADVLFGEILPIIESKKALNNLQNIINGASLYFNKVAFGHCDYNLSIDSLPFFHQYSAEYWKWVNRIIEIASANNITFVNSVFLYLGDNEFFGKMLSHLSHIAGNGFGQATLTSRQSELCNNFNKSFTGFKTLIDDRSELSIPENYAQNIIKDFEDKHKERGSSSKLVNKALLSPQEYVMAKTYSSAKCVINRRLVFVGGCFPVQYNILFEDLFHQSLKKYFKTKNYEELDIKLIRYERFSNCLDKIRNYCDTAKIDKLILHIRPEPYLRLLKLYYKYKKQDGKKRGALNMPMFKIINPEKYDVYEIERSFPNYISIKRSGINNGLLADLNYLTGFVFGNLFFAANKYVKLTSDIFEYCKQKKIDFIVLGPPGRNLTALEPLFCNYLNKQVKEFCLYSHIPFIDNMMGENVGCFDDSKKFATQECHNRIANKIFNEIK
jgi:citrate lyase beta subunit